MPTTSESNLVWRNCPQNPWELHLHAVLDPVACELARKYPRCLVFNTTVASLRFKKPTNAKENDTGNNHGDAKVPLDICDEEYCKIGHIKMGRQWMERVIDFKKKHSFLVLCGGLLSRFERRGLSRRYPYNYDPRSETPWVLIVMLIQRDGGVARRLGLGYVETGLWGTVEPTWETIVLT